MLIDDPKVLLRAAYGRKREKNPRYSKRAFSRLLGIPSGRLSELMAGKRPLNSRLGEKIGARLELAREERTRFLRSIEEFRWKQTQSRRLASLAREANDQDYSELAQDTYSLIRDWYHLAILSLMKTRDFKSDPRWMARRLGISVAEVRQALGRLTRLELIRREGKKYVRTHEKLKSTSDIASTALRESHRQNLALAARSLDTVELLVRDITSITMAIDVSKIESAKRMIRNFRRGIADLLEEGECSEVYNLNIALYPVTQKKEKT